METEKLVYYIHLLDDLANGRVAPRRIVGTGYKDARKVAFTYIAGQLKQLVEAGK